MPLIQRNLFPRRPPSAKCDGPSVLKAAAKSTPTAKVPSAQSQSPPTAQSVPAETAKPTPTGTATKKRDPPKKGSAAKSHRKLLSASLNSLLVIGQSGKRSMGATAPKNSNYDGSHDSFHCSTDSR